MGRIAFAVCLHGQGMASYCEGETPVSDYGGQCITSLVECYLYNIIGLSTILKVVLSSCWWDKEDWCLLCADT